MERFFIKRSILDNNDKTLKILENLLFDLVFELNQKYQLKQYDKYKLALASLQIINEEYNQITGRYYIDKQQIMEYYRQLWDF